jgi:hypothetical protein
MGLKLNTYKMKSITESSLCLEVSDIDLNFQLYILNPALLLYMEPVSGQKFSLLCLISSKKNVKLKSQLYIPIGSMF